MASFAGLYDLVAERTLRWKFYSWYWGDAIAVDGLLSETGSEAGRRRGRVIAQIERWAETAPDNFDDALAPGLAIMRLVGDGRLNEAAAQRFVDAVDRLPLLEGGFPALEPQRPTFRFGLCIDAIYHLPPALAAHGMLTGDSDRVAAAVDMAIEATRLLHCPDGWAQWYDSALDLNNAIAWSRGIGWALLGLVDLLAIETAVRKTEIEVLVVSMLERLAETQEPDGHWAAVLGDRHAPSETSTAAFFIAAVEHPVVRRLWTPDPAVCQRAVDALVASIDDQGVATGVSADILPSWAIDGYRSFHCEPSPWGQGAMLRALAALDESETRG